MKYWLELNLLVPVRAKIKVENRQPNGEQMTDGDEEPPINCSLRGEERAAELSEREHSDLIAECGVHARGRAKHKQAAMGGAFELQ